MKIKPLIKHCGLATGIAFLAATSQSSALSFVTDVSIDGTDAIWLAGRTDLSVPAYGTGGTPAGWEFIRHSPPGTPEGLVETFPPFISVLAGDIIQVADPAVGGISFFQGFGGTIFGPEGNSPTSQLSAIGGISAYLGTQGALVGVFLDDSIPNGAAPAALDFLSAAARDFESLAPGLGQVFFIGDGVNSAATRQSFTAPTGATRLFFGVPDGFNFVGAPGAYDDNDGGYRIRVGINADPTVAVPEPAGLALIPGLLLLGWLGRRGLRTA